MRKEKAHREKGEGERSGLRVKIRRRSSVHLVLSPEPATGVDRTGEGRKGRRQEGGFAEGGDCSDVSGRDARRSSVAAGSAGINAADGSNERDSRALLPER